MCGAFWHLAVRAWFAMAAATGTNSLGLLLWAIGVAVAVWIAAVAYEWKRIEPQPRKIRIALGKSFPVAVAGIGVVSLIACVWVVFLIRTVYYERTGLRWAYSKEVRSSQDLERQLKYRENEMDTSDPVFGNIIALLGAFSSFRNSLHGESCVIVVTAPPDSQSVAQAVAQLQIATSNCTTYGPDELFDRNPDLRTKTVVGMVSGSIVFHAVKNDVSANQLFSRLSNQFSMVRSYAPQPSADYQSPSGGFRHTVWLQFGPDVKWVGELRGDQ